VGPVPARMLGRSRVRCGAGPGADVGPVPAQMWGRSRRTAADAWTLRAARDRSAADDGATESTVRRESHGRASPIAQQRLRRQGRRGVNADRGALPQ
jgi:hypothetical protein